jgi:hypothetical protein
MLTVAELKEQRGTYQTVSGKSLSDLCIGFMPAFRDVTTGETHLALRPDGSLSPVHLIDGLPSNWVSKWDSNGRAMGLKSTIVAGFFRGERFYSLRDLENSHWDA